VAFNGNTLTISGLIKLELPTGDVRLCDGGFVRFNSELYEADHPDFGSFQTIGDFREGFGEELPIWQMTLFPKSTAASVTLSQASFQGSRMRIWLAEVDSAAGLVVGTPELCGDFTLDSTVLRFLAGERSLLVSVVSRAERLLLTNEGNVCSSRFHQSIWPGEMGFDNATGQNLAVAWGIEGAPRGTIGQSYNGGFGGGFGGGGGSRGFFEASY
jgi:hypothetical protein